MIAWNRLVLLVREAGAAGLSTFASGQHFRELCADDCEWLSLTYRQHGRRGDRERFLRRFDHGFRCFGIEEDGSLVGWFWAIHDAPRYLDELAWRFELDRSVAWGRDAFIAPRIRGKRLFSAMLDAAAAMEQGPKILVSDVSANNLLSLHAHARLGFRRFVTVQSLVLGRRLMWRSRPPGGPLPAPTGLRTERRWLWLSDEEYAWHRRQIA